MGECITFAPVHRVRNCLSESFKSESHLSKRTFGLQHGTIRNPGTTRMSDTARIEQPCLNFSPPTTTTENHAKTNGATHFRKKAKALVQPKPPAKDGRLLKFAEPMGLELIDRHGELQDPHILVGADLSQRRTPGKPARPIGPRSPASWRIRFTSGSILLIHYKRKHVFCNIYIYI